MLEAFIILLVFIIAFCPGGKSEYAIQFHPNVQFCRGNVCVCILVCIEWEHTYTRMYQKYDICAIIVHYTRKWCSFRCVLGLNNELSPHMNLTAENSAVLNAVISLLVEICEQNYPKISKYLRNHIDTSNFPILVSTTNIYFGIRFSLNNNIRKWYGWSVSIISTFLSHVS